MSRLLLQLSLPHDWDQIEPVRQAIGLCVGAVFGKPGRQEAIAMVASELLENAIKHGRPSSLIQLAIDELEGEMSIVVTNELADGADTAPFEQRIAWINSFSDPSEAYQAAMEKAFTEMSEGGLGLPRIAHEGGCKISWEAASPGLLTVRARLAERD